MIIITCKCVQLCHNWAPVWVLCRVYLLYGHFVLNIIHTLYEYACRDHVNLHRCVFCCCYSRTQHCNTPEHVTLASPMSSYGGGFVRERPNALLVGRVCFAVSSSEVAHLTGLHDLTVFPSVENRHTLTFLDSCFCWRLRANSNCKSLCMLHGSGYSVC